MTRKWVFNASPLTLLGSVDRLGMLAELCDELAVPEAVAREIAKGGKEDPAARWLAAEGSGFVCSRMYRLILSLSPGGLETARQPY